MCEQHQVVNFIHYFRMLPIKQSYCIFYSLQNCLVRKTECLAIFLFLAEEHFTRYKYIRSSVLNNKWEVHWNGFAFVEITILVKYSWMILMFAEVLTELVVVDYINVSGPWFYMKPELCGLQNTLLWNWQLKCWNIKGLSISLGALPFLQWTNQSQYPHNKLSIWMQSLV